MYLLQLFAYIIFHILQNSQGVQSGSFCPQTAEVIPICKNRTITNSTTVYIDTVEVPKVKIISCTCIISNTVNTEKLIFSILNITTKNKMKFEIMGKVFDKRPSSSEIDIKSRSKLTFTSYGNLDQDGACLIIYNTAQRRDITFNISCMEVSPTPTTYPVQSSTTTRLPSQRTTTTIRPLKSSTTTMIETSASWSPTSANYTAHTEQTISKESQTPTSKTKQTGSTTVRSPSSTTIEPNKSQSFVSPNESNNNKILVSVVSATSGLSIGLVVGFVYICCKRVRKKKTAREESATEMESRDGNSKTEIQVNRNNAEILTVNESLENVYHQIELDVEVNHPAEESIETHDISNIIPDTQDEQAFANAAEGDSFYDSTFNKVSKPFQEGNVYSHLEQVDESNMCLNDTYNRIGNRI